MCSLFSIFGRPAADMLLLSMTILCLLAGQTYGITKIRDGADPTVMKFGDSWYSAESAGGGIWVRKASSITGLGASDVERKEVWSDPNGLGAVWAPEITTEDGKTYIYFAAGESEKHRMYVISASDPIGNYGGETKLALPDDRWAIDGVYFRFNNKRWFVWSGWAGTENIEQNLYICEMESPTKPIGARYIISQPRESWELIGNDKPLINEGPEAIVDPNGQLHIVYSANGSWGSKYCLADLRLKAGGDPTYVWDWYKSNGCLFGSDQAAMMNGWDATLYVNGPGHHTFALTDGDVGKSPVTTERVPFVFHAVLKGTDYSWANRDWFPGTYVWWGKITYSRKNVPGDNENTGYSFKFFE